MGLLALVTLIQIAAPQATPAPPEEQGVVMADDYPAEALENGWQGHVQVDLTVGTNGRANACQVTKSSRYKVLDDATCRIFITRARFKPSVDAGGNPIEGHYQTHLDWRIRF
jgi:protein TonB